MALVYYLDDEVELCNIVKAAFAQTNVQIETFILAEPFYEAMALQKPDLVVIDYRLTETTGDHVAENLDATLPKILITGELDVKTHTQWTKILSKPIRLAALKTAVMEVLRAR